MTPFDVRIPTTLRYSGDPMKLESLLTEFVDYILDLYIEGVMNELSRESRYSKRWESKSQEFKQYMRSKGLPETISLNPTLLKEAFRVKKFKSHYLLEMSSVPRVANKCSLLSYMRLVEFGTSKFPARYIMTPVKKDLELNMRYYWNNFYETHVERVPTKIRKPTHYERYLERRSSR